MAAEGRVPVDTNRILRDVEAIKALLATTSATEFSSEEAERLAFEVGTIRLQLHRLREEQAALQSELARRALGS